MDKELLEQVVQELAVLLPGARIDRITQTDGDGICLHLHCRRSRLYLLLSPDRRYPRMHLLSKRPEPGSARSQILLFLRKQLVGARISGLRMLNDDRVVEIAFIGSQGNVRLMFELTGMSANVLLLDRDGTIRFVLVPRSLESGGQRLLVPGAVYTPPTVPAREQGTKRGAAVPAVPGENGIAANRAAERYALRCREQRDTDALRQSLTTAVARALGKVERRIAAINGDLERAERAEEFQAAGSAILANLGTLRKGMEHAELAGIAGGVIGVSLDPARTPTENADSYFRRAKKARSSISRVRERLDDAHEEADLLRLAAEDIPFAPDREALQHIHDRVLRLGLLPGRKKHRSAETPAMAGAVRTVRFDGWEILIGKNAAGNDRITRTMAGPDDLWLHAEGMPGSHVLVRNPARRDIPEAVLRRAAALAAHFSKARNAAKVPVTFTRARFVRKPKGSKPGLAVLTERRSIMVAPEAP